MKKILIIAAHPDDEVLWFSSILSQCKKVIVCYSRSPEGSGRKTVIDTFPLDNVEFLDFQGEDSVYLTADWENPEETDYGLKLGKTNTNYISNFDKLTQILEPMLMGEKLVFTHNPWGEYGHEEHVQLYKVMRSLQKKLGFKMMVNSYVSNRTQVLMRRYMPYQCETNLMIKTDKVVGENLKALYLRHKCWTWNKNYIWPDNEYFFDVSYCDAPHSDRRISCSIPLNIIWFPKKKIGPKILLKRIISKLFH